MPVEYVQVVLSHQQAQFQVPHDKPRVDIQVDMFLGLDHTAVEVVRIVEEGYMVVALDNPVVAHDMAAAVPSTAHFQVPGMVFLKTEKDAHISLYDGIAAGD